MRETRIIQLSDCHVSAQADATYRGINPRRELERLFPFVREWAPDLLLVTGDLAEDGSREAYVYVHELLAELDVPVYTLPGNHDVAEMQAGVFANTALDQPLVVDAGDRRLVLLNSSRPGLIGGRLDELQLRAVEAELEAHDGPALIFLHHQPFPVGSPWIDRYALENFEAFWSRVCATGRVEAVAWGHVHQVFEAGRNNVRLLSAPSTAINSVPAREKFLPDSRGPACRWFRINHGGTLESGILAAHSSGSTSHKMM